MSPNGMEHHDHNDPRFRRLWVGGWTSAIFTTLGTLLWCLLIYWLVGSRPPSWQYGVIPYVPGESISSSQAPPSLKKTPNQVVLPRKTTGGPGAKR